MEQILEVLNTITGGIGYATLIGIGLAAITRLIPNDKLHSIGYKIGQSITVAGAARFGLVWERIEDFSINSVGMILTGIKKGLDSNDGGQSSSLKPESKDDVRI